MREGDRRRASMKVEEGVGGWGLESKAWCCLVIVDLIGCNFVGERSVLHSAKSASGPASEPAGISRV